MGDKSLPGLMALFASAKPTLRAVLEELTRSGQAAKRHLEASDGPAALLVPAPYIPRDHRHYDFAVAVYFGSPYKAACDALEIPYRTAEGWRAEMRRVAEAYFGREVTYEFAIRYILEDEWRDLLREVETALRTAEPSPAPGAAPAPLRRTARFATASFPA